MTEDIISEIEKLLDYKSSSSDGDITFVETDIAKNTRAINKSIYNNNG